MTTTPGTASTNLPRTAAYRRVSTTRRRLVAVSRDGDSLELTSTTPPGVDGDRDRNEQPALRLQGCTPSHAGTGPLSPTGPACLFDTDIRRRAIGSSPGS